MSYPIIPEPENKLPDDVEADQAEIEVPKEEPKEEDVTPEK